MLHLKQNSDESHYTAKIMKVNTLHNDKTQ